MIFSRNDDAEDVGAGDHYGGDEGGQLMTIVVDDE